MSTVGAALGDDRRMTVVEHLTELRRVLIVSLAAWLAATAAAFAFHTRLLALIERPLLGVLRTGHHLSDAPIVTSPTETLTIPLKVAAVVGLAGALPVIVWQLWGFVAPALRKSERRIAAPLMVSAIALFAGGVALAYAVMPVALTFLASFLAGNAAFLPDLGAYIGFFTLLAAVFGVTFELPVAVVLLGMVGVVSSQRLRHWRRGIWLGIAAAAFVITPGADPITPTMLAVPLIVLFEISVVVLARGLHR